MLYSDLNTILQIENELFSHPWSKQMYIQEIENHHAYLIEDNGVILGFICGWDIYDESHITNLGIRKNYQRRGLASKLLHFFINKKEKEGWETFFLEVRESNTSAVSFYKNHGFLVVGKRKKYYKNPTEDAFIMMKLSDKKNEKSKKN